MFESTIQRDCAQFRSPRTATPSFPSLPVDSVGSGLYQLASGLSTGANPRRPTDATLTHQTPMKPSDALRRWRLAGHPAQRSMATTEEGSKQGGGVERWWWWCGGVVLSSWSVDSWLHQHNPNPPPTPLTYMCLILLLVLLLLLFFFNIPTASQQTDLAYPPQICG